MVNEDKNCISERCCYICPICCRSSECTAISPIVDGTTVHTDYNNDADGCHNNLKDFAILNFAKKEPDTQPKKIAIAT